MSVPYQLHNKDCAEVIPMLTEVSAVITDPPYGLKRFEKGFGYTRFKGYGAEKVGITWDKKPLPEFLETLLSIGKVRVIWGANNFELPPSESFLVWDKFQTVDNFASAELAYCDKEGLTAKVFRFPIQKHNQVEKFHPTQKPVELMRWCVELVSSPDDVIFDPYMGSGTTGVAALQLGRRFIGCEINPEYFAIAEKRIKQAAQQPALLHVAQQSVQRTGGESGQQSLFSAGEVLPAKVTRQSTRR